MSWGWQPVLEKPGTAGHGLDGFSVVLLEPGLPEEGHSKGDGRGSFCTGFWPLKVEGCSAGMVTGFHPSWLRRLQGASADPAPAEELLRGDSRDPV